MKSAFPFLRISRTGHHIHRLERILLKAMSRDHIIYKIQAQVLGRSPESVRNIASREIQSESNYGTHTPRTNLTVSLDVAAQVKSVCNMYGLTMGQCVEFAMNHMLRTGVLDDAEDSPLESIRLLKSPGFGAQWKEFERMLLLDADRLRQDSLPFNPPESPSASILPKINGHSHIGSHNAGK